MPGPPDPNAAPPQAQLAGGDESAAARLMDTVYDELRALAGGYFRQQPGAHTLQPTALVHEAFVRVSERTGAHFESRAHFAALCAVAMRSILTDHARRRGRRKRGGDWNRVALSDVATPAGAGAIDALDLDQALTELEGRSARQARVVEYRFFSGLSVDEIAEVLDLSRSTVEEDWRMARAWLMVRLKRDCAP